MRRLKNTKPYTWDIPDYVDMGDIRRIEGFDDLTSDTILDYIAPSHQIEKEYDE